MGVGVLWKYMRRSLTNTEKQQKGVECTVWREKSSKTAPKPNSSQTHSSSLRLDVTKSAFLTNPLVSMTSAISLLKSYVPLPVYWPSDSPVVIFSGLKCFFFFWFVFVFFFPHLPRVQIYSLSVCLHQISLILQFVQMLCLPSPLMPKYLCHCRGKSEQLMTQSLQYFS